MLIFIIYIYFSGQYLQTILDTLKFLFSLVLEFIVVSLKGGMFNNAYVLFRTKSVDGVSTVERSVVGNKQNK